MHISLEANNLPIQQRQRKKRQRNPYPFPAECRFPTEQNLHSKFQDQNIPQDGIRDNHQKRDNGGLCEQGVVDDQNAAEDRKREPYGDWQQRQPEECPLRGFVQKEDFAEEVLHCVQFICKSLLPFRHSPDLCEKQMIHSSGKTFLGVTFFMIVFSGIER